MICTSDVHSYRFRYERSILKAEIRTNSFADRKTRDVYYNDFVSEATGKHVALWAAGIVSQKDANLIDLLLPNIGRRFVN